MCENDMRADSLTQAQCPSCARHPTGIALGAITPRSCHANAPPRRPRNPCHGPRASLERTQKAPPHTLGAASTPEARNAQPVAPPTRNLLVLLRRPEVRVRGALSAGRPPLQRGRRCRLPLQEPDTAACGNMHAWRGTHTWERMPSLLEATSPEGAGSSRGLRAVGSTNSREPERTSS